MKHVKKHAKRHVAKAFKTTNEVPLILLGASLFVATLVTAEIFGRPMAESAARQRPTVTRVEGDTLRGAAPTDALDEEDKWDCGAKAKTQKVRTKTQKRAVR